jgi:hypothetical protein
MAGTAPLRTAIALGAVALLSATTSIAGASDAPRVEVIESAGGQPWQVISLGDSLVGPAPWPNDGRQATAPSWPPRVLVSDDAKHWRAVDLPGAPPNVRLNPRGIAQVGGRAVVAGMIEGRDQRELLVWVSRDGDTWRGGAVPTVSSASWIPDLVAAGARLLFAALSERGRVAIHHTRDGESWQQGIVQSVEASPNPRLVQAWTEDDDLVALLAVGAQDGPDPVQIRSRDGGKTWRQERCPATPKHCGVRLAARGLELRGLHASTDEGETWERIRFRPEIADADPDAPFRPEPRSLRRAGDGWLMTAAYSRNQESHHEILLHSTDGRTWRRLVPAAPCDSSPGDPSSTVSPPRRAAGRWYTAYVCTTWADNPEFDGVDDARVYVGDRRGERWDWIGGVPLVEVDELLRFDGRLLVPFGGSISPGGPVTAGFLEIVPPG